MNKQIQDDLVSAMKSKDTFKLSVLRMLKSALQLEKISKKHELTDDEVNNVLKKQVKMRKDSLEEYKKYNKLDEVANLEKEIAIIEEYLPKEISEEELEKLVLEAISSTNASSMKEMGLVMKKLNELLIGKNADMSKASSMVKTKLNN